MRLRSDGDLHITRLMPVPPGMREGSANEMAREQGPTGLAEV